MHDFQLIEKSGADMLASMTPAAATATTRALAGLRYILHFSATGAPAAPAASRQSRRRWGKHRQLAAMRLRRRLGDVIRRRSGAARMPPGRCWDAARAPLLRRPRVLRATFARHSRAAPSPLARCWGADRAPFLCTARRSGHDSDMNDGRGTIADRRALHDGAFCRLTAGACQETCPARAEPGAETGR